MWKELLTDISNIEKEYGDDLNKPAFDDEINIFLETAKKKFGKEVPKSFIELLKTANGLDFNGLIFYGIDNSLLQSNNTNIYGYIEYNEIWYENEYQKKYIFFGENDISWYCYDLLDDNYVELDKPSGSLINVYLDFFDMVEEALKISLL